MWVTSFKLFKLVFITEHHPAPVLLYVGLSELQSTALVSLRQSRGLALFKSVQSTTVHCSLHCLIAHIGNSSVSSAPLRSRDSSGVVFSAFSSPQSAPHSLKVSVFVLHPPHPRASQSRCISISSVSQIAARIQSCDKSQQSSSLRCARKLLHLDLRVVCATCVSFEKIGKKPVPTKTPNLEYVVCCVVNICVGGKELSRAREVPSKQ